MNIIANNCLGARLYEVNKVQFPNSFMWCRLYIKDFIKLINDFDNINFNNALFDIEFRLNHNCVKCIIDNKITVHYGHYVYDKNIDIPTKAVNNTDIIYSDILNYAKHKYFSRLNRSTESPIFLYSFNNKEPHTKEYENELSELLTIKKPLFIIIHDTVNIPSYIPDNITIIKCSNEVMTLTGTKLAIEIQKKIKLM